MKDAVDPVSDSIGNSAGGTAFKIALLDDYHGLALTSADWSSLPAGCEITVFRRHLANADEAIRELRPFHLLCTLRERMPIPAGLIKQLPNLRHIVVTGKRYDTIDVAAAAANGVSVSICPPVRSSAGPGGVVELVWGLIIAVARGIPMEDRMLRQGHWQVDAGITLGGKTLGIIGLGQLGRGVAKIGRAFGMEVVAWSQNLTDAAANAIGARRLDKDELLAVSDVVTIHTVLSERTRGLIGTRELALMKPSAFLINTSRGPIVDEAALVAALRSRQIAGVGLDVYWREPLPADHPLLALGNAVLTPHLGYYTRDALRGYYAGAVENVKAFLAGDPIRLVAAPEERQSAS